jgi:hypothetical protein
MVLFYLWYLVEQIGPLSKRQPQPAKEQASSCLEVLSSPPGCQKPMMTVLKVMAISFTASQSCGQ